MVSMSLAEVIAHQARLNRKSFEDSQGENEAFDEESAFHEAITAFLKRAGVHGVIHSRMDKATTQSRGIPDFLFAVDGVPIALEAKVKGRKVSPEQKGWLMALEMDGWTVAVVRCIEDVGAVVVKAKKRL